MLCDHFSADANNVCVFECLVPTTSPRDLTPVAMEDKSTIVTLNWQPPRHANGQISGSLCHLIHSFIMEIYIAPLQGYYSEALPTLARLKRRVL